MKRSSAPGLRALWAIVGGLVLVGTAGPAAAAATCKSNEPRVQIDGDDPRDVPDFVFVAGSWVRNTVRLVPQSSTRPRLTDGGEQSWIQVGGTAVTLTYETNAQGQKVAVFDTPDVPTDTTLTFELAVTCAGAGGAPSTAKDRITVNVRNAYSLNSAPTASAAASPAIAQDGDTVQLVGSASDVDGDALTHQWVQIGGPGVSLTNANAATASFIAPNTANSNGATLVFRLTVSDGRLSDAKEVTVNVTWVNDPPLARLACPADLLDLVEGQPFTLDGSGSGDFEDGSALGYAWSGGPWATATSGWDETAILPLGALTTATVNLTAPHLTYQQVGKFTYRVTATDAGGLFDFAECDVFVRDITPPVISVPQDITAEATEPAGARIGYLVSATDNVDGPLPGVSFTEHLVCEPSPGSLFNLDETTAVLCSARDSAGNGAEAGFHVTVVDTTPPVVSAPLSQAAEATGPAGAVVTFDATAEDIVDGTRTADCTPPSGSTFALGDTTVTCGATDTHGNVAIPATFTVSVLDTQPPVISDVPANQTAEATSAAGATVGYTLPSAHDLVDGDVAVSCAPASGSVFALGDTPVTCDAADTRGNSTALAGTSATFTVTVVDTTPPALSGMPGHQVLEATSAAGASFTYAPTAVDLVAGPVPVSCSPVSGTTFALDSITPVTCTASDGFSNTVSASFTVTVRDTTGPTIAPHADVYAYATGNSQAVVHYDTPTASDLVDGPVTATCLPASGNTFTAGATQITCSAQDSRGNPASPVHFDVEVGYNWNGFFAPVDNPSTFNSVKAGSAIPVKFNLGGNQGLAIFATNSPASSPIACSATDGDAVEETVTAGSSSLQYDPGTGQYIYVWKTEKAWVGQCRVLQVKLRDGQVKSALFKFK